jgi:hypothetical protein
MKKTTNIEERFYTFDQVKGHRKWADGDLWKQQKERLAKFLEEYKKTATENGNPKS